MVVEFDVFVREIGTLVCWATLKEHLGTNNILDLKGWKAEIKTLASEKRCLYSEVHSLQDEVQEAETIRKCVEQTVQTEQTKTKIKRKNMEL